ncbi:MAG: rRNA maturation RNase YbeY [Dysgonamonadaceae bacterium]|jgi:rRNA maturation RNase YbeY|nr:rRNA maturation RNase YbeY [Dysgonamonadaceae bacterium]
MAILYHSVEIQFPSIKRREVTNWIKKIASSHNKKIGEISYIFCSDKEILRINEQYLNHDYYTDIITFDYTEANTLSGDIFISLETVKSNSEKYLSDYQEELHRVIIHGILHLCGLKDKTPQEEQLMRESENRALTLLSIGK